MFLCGNKPPSIFVFVQWLLDSRTLKNWTVQVCNSIVTKSMMAITSPIEKMKTSTIFPSNALQIVIPVYLRLVRHKIVQRTNAENFLLAFNFRLVLYLKCRPPVVLWKIP
mmetsp:Transcript_43239/g.79067  ORF Transcript_43239/g.79067 Transcript_43239/m.79067 type:complete len:110 (+) Transcript_43239:91-420(+)